MNYIWEILLQAKTQGIEESRIRFLPAVRYSPYMERSDENLNQAQLAPPYEIEINPYYRFSSIFRSLFLPDVKEYPQLRRELFQLFIHELGKNDVRMGMTREEYYKKLLWKDIQSGVYGSEVWMAVNGLTREEREYLLSGILRQYRTGNSLEIYRDMMGALFTGSIVYHNESRAYDLVVYIGRRYSGEEERKVLALEAVFVGIQYTLDLYFEHHFGLFGIDDTMELEEMAMY